MKATGLVVLLAHFVLLARSGQAQHYLAEHTGTKQKIVVPGGVVKSFQQSFPSVTHDSIRSWEYNVTPEGYTPVLSSYTVVFTQHGVQGKADFSEQGKLEEYEAEIAVDSLPAPVLKTITRKLLWKNARQKGYTLRAFVRVGRDFGKGKDAYRVYHYSIYIKGADGMYMNDEWIYPNGKISKVVRFR